MKLLAALVALVWTFKALEMLGVIGHNRGQDRDARGRGAPGRRKRADVGWQVGVTAIAPARAGVTGGAGMKEIPIETAKTGAPSRATADLIRVGVYVLTDAQGIVRGVGPTPACALGDVSDSTVEARKFVEDGVLEMRLVV